MLRIGTVAMAKVDNKIEMCKKNGENFSKNVPARNEKE